MANIEISTFTRNNDGNTYVVKDANAIPKSGSSAISGDLIPSSDGTVNLGSSSGNYNNVYTYKVKNGTDNNEVRIYGGNNEDISGVIAIYSANHKYHPGRVRLVARTSTNSEYELSARPDGTLTWTGNVIRPNSNNACDLGTSTYKWKSINGIAPDELGLPTSTYTDVSSYITNFDSTPNTFTAPVSGLLFIGGNAPNIRECAIFNNTKGYMINLSYAYYNIRGLIPVEKGDSISVYINQSVNLTAAVIYHLKGKV